MADPKIVITAEDRTKAAVESVKSGLTGIHTKAVAVTGALGAIGAGVALVALASQVQAAAERLDEMGKAAQRVGFASAQAFAEYRFAAELAGVEANQFENAVGKLNTKMAAAAGGNKEAAAFFKALGIEIKGANGQLRAGEAVLGDMAEKFASWRDGPEKSALAAAGFGDEVGRKMVTLLNGGRQGLEQARGEFRKLHTQISEQNVKDAETYNDNLSKLETAASSLGVSLANKFLPSLVAITNEMVRATKEGGLFKGVIAGIQTLLTGDDLHKANVEMVEAGDRILNIQKQMDRVRSGELTPTGSQGEIIGRDAGLARLQKQLEAEQERFARARGFRDMLEGGQPGAGGAAAAGGTAKPAAPVVPTGGDGNKTDKDFASLIRGLKDRIGDQDLELSLGRQPNAQERFGDKLRRELNDPLKEYTETQKKAALADLEASNAKFALIEARTKQLAWDKHVREEQEKNRAEIAEAQRQDQAEQKAVALRISGETRALADSNKMLELEGRLINANAKERAIAIEHLRIELELRRQLDELNSNLSLTPEIRAREGARLRANAQTAKDQVSVRVDLDERMEFTETLRGDLRGALTRAFEDSKNPGKAFVDAIASTMYTRVTGALTDAFLASMGLGGPGGKGFGFGGMRFPSAGDFQSSFSSTALGSSGFGSGLAYGNQDLGLFLHGGGVAGKEATFTRPVDARLFMGARRYHGGGLAGNEVPAILEEGEGVFTKEQMKALGGRRGGGLTFAPVTTVHIDSRSDRAAVQRDVAALMAERDRQWREDLERAGVLG